LADVAERDASTEPAPPGPAAAAPHRSRALRPRSLLPPARARARSLAAAKPMWLDLAMRSVKIAELKDRLSEHLRAVERGAEIEVRDRDRPIARLVPASRDGVQLRFAPPKRAFSTVRDRRPRPARWKKSSLELLLEERGSR
jgi:prevent-host-death family protein